MSPLGSECRLGVIAQYRYGSLHLGAGFAKWLPDLRDGEANQLFGPLLHVPGYIGRCIAADGSRLLAPLKERLAGAHDGGLYIVWPRLLELPWNFSRVMWVDALECHYDLPDVARCCFQSYPEQQTRA
jgi:hypothetical protein